MNAADFPAGRVWVPVTDLPSALAALALLRALELPPEVPAGEGDHL